MVDDTPAIVNVLIEFGLTEEEAGFYLRALEAGRVPEGRGKVVETLSARGMLIQASDEKTYLPVHPRLALSNLFRSYQAITEVKRREKRRIVDSTTSKLIPFYERGKRS
jgi:hypothetical protein